MLVILWGLATPLWSSSTKGWWIITRSYNCYFQLTGKFFLFSGLNTLSFIATITLAEPMPDFHSCCFPYVVSLQKGLLKVNSGELRSSTNLEVDTHCLQPVQLGSVVAAVQPKHYTATQRAKR